MFLTASSLCFHICDLQARLPRPQPVVGEEEGLPWVVERYELENEAIDEQVQDAPDDRLLLDPAARNLKRVAEEVRNRLVECFSLGRHDEEIQGGEQSDEEIQEGEQSDEDVDGDLDEHEEHEFHLIIPNGVEVA